MAGTGRRSSSFSSTLVDVFGFDASVRRANVRSCDTGMLRLPSRSSAPHNKPSSPTQDLAEPAALPFGPFMAYGHELLLDLSKLGAHSLADWLPPEHEARAASTGRAQ